jgi:hypothetical protein
LGDINALERARVAGAREGRGPKRWCKHRKSGRGKEEGSEKKGGGAGATGIEPETAIQEIDSVTKHPQNTAFTAHLFSVFHVSCGCNGSLPLSLLSPFPFSFDQIPLCGFKLTSCNPTPDYVDNE